MRPFRPEGLRIGLGLVSIGRVWGVAGSPVPTDAEAAALLDAALDCGVRIFDTAPAYAASERRLGAYLAGLDAGRRADVVVMTKVGEHWDDEAGAPYVDHSYDAMMRSFERSMTLLGSIDVLQLHKATEDAIASEATARVFRHAQACGVRTAGASVATVEAGALALRSGSFSALQFPLNAQDGRLEPLVAALEAAGGFAIVNRPFGMGAAVHGADDKHRAAVAAFRFQRERVPNGVVLTGTGRAAHLRENIAAFAESAG